MNLKSRDAAHALNQPAVRENDVHAMLLRLVAAAFEREDHESAANLLRETAEQLERLGR